MLVLDKGEWFELVPQTEFETSIIEANYLPGEQLVEADRHHYWGCDSTDPERYSLLIRKRNYQEPQGEK